ncbi:ABC transporter ATP-binding protein [Gordonia sp. NPDC003376]
MSTPVVTASALTRRFGSFTAVDDVTFTVSPGEVVGLLGANGAGKTTVIRMLLGLLAPSAGSVGLFGGPPAHRARARLGYVPQNLGLYRDLTVAENLAFTADIYGVEVPALTSDLADRADTLVGDLALGAQRQAAFTVALAHHPEVLVLDEPTSGVDALSRSRLWDTIGEQAEAGVAVLVTTHYMEEAQECDRLLLMSSGRLVAQGTEADVIGGLQATRVRSDDWSATFTVLADAGLPVILSGTTIRVAATPPDQVAAVLSARGITVDVDEVPGTIEERMLVLARDQAVP